MTFRELLTDLNACSDAMDWLQDKTVEEAVATAPKGEWLLWLAHRISIDKKLLTLTAGHCANTVRHLMTDKRSADAVDAAIAFGEGRISQSELDQCAEAARAAWATEAARAVWAAETEAARAAWAAWAAWGAAWVTGAVEAATATAREQNEKQTADICRKYIGDAIIEAVNNELLTTKNK